MRTGQGVVRLAAEEEKIVDVWELVSNPITCDDLDGNNKFLNFHGFFFLNLKIFYGAPWSLFSLHIYTPHHDEYKSVAFHLL